jgi:Na+-translocating ferredoxin:NAD+ oxidoreductase RnfD subunit
MNNKFDQDNSQVSDQLHPFVYAALAGLALWLVMSAWIFFSQGGYLELDLGIVSALVFMIIAIPTVLHFVRRRFQVADRASSVAPRFARGSPVTLI